MVLPPQTPCDDRKPVGDGRRPGPPDGRPGRKDRPSNKKNTQKLHAGLGKFGEILAIQDADAALLQFDDTLIGPGGELTIHMLA